jgi:integrase
MTTYYKKGLMIWLNYYVDGVRIRKSTKLKYTFQNIKIVKNQIIPALNIKIATGEIYKKKPKTFEYYGGIFLEQKESNRSFWQKRNYYLRVIDYFRGNNIDTITRLDVKKYLISLNMKSKSKAEYKNCAKEIFELAVDDGVINFNPALDIRLKPDKKEPIQFYTKEEVQNLLSVATGIIKPYLEIAFNTGMRVSEILGLQLSDFNEDGYIHIKRTRSKGIIGSGKNNNAIRRVPYSKYILDTVKKVQTNHIFIFGYIDDASLLRSQWEHVCKNAGVPRYKLYSTRHTFATLMLKENIVSINEFHSLVLK